MRVLWPHRLRGLGRSTDARHPERSGEPPGEDHRKNFPKRVNLSGPAVVYTGESATLAKQISEIF